MKNKIPIPKTKPLPYDTVKRGGSDVSIIYLIAMAFGAISWFVYLVFKYGVRH